MNEWLLALMVTAATVGALHSLAPDHWVPFATLARTRNWSAQRTARLAAICGFGHVTVSALLGIFAVLLGREVVERFGAAVHGRAPLLIIAFGLTYTLWALWRLSRRKLMHQVDHLEGVEHDHGRGTHHHHHKHGVTEWSLFVLFCADPCIALIPMIVAASTQGWGAIGAVIAIYEVATIAAIVILVHTANAGTKKIRFAWVDRYGELLAGSIILTLGTVISFSEGLF